jgi:hypothetical protein
MGHDGMRFWDSLQLLLGFSRRPQTRAGESAGSTAAPKKRDVKVVRLNAASKSVLSKALRALEPGHKGWISFDDAARLFSPSSPSKWDEACIRGLADFAADIEHRSSPERRARDERVYFTRIRTLL